MDGVSGHIILDAANDELIHPQVSFVPLTGTKAKFIMPIDDIVEIKKVSFSYIPFAVLKLISS